MTHEDTLRGNGKPRTYRHAPRGPGALEQMEGAPMRTKKNQELDPESPQNAAPLDPEATSPAGPQIATGKRCQGRDKRGMPCTAWAVKNGTRCYFHANPEKVSELGRLKEKKRVGTGGSVQEIRSDGTVLHLLHRLPLPRHPQAAGLALDSELPSQRAGNLESAGAFTLPPKPKKRKKKKKSGT